jgi:hypothetical protein
MNPGCLGLGIRVSASKHLACHDALDDGIRQLPHAHRREAPHDSTHGAKLTAAGHSRRGEMDNAAIECAPPARRLPGRHVLERIDYDHVLSSGGRNDGALANALWPEQQHTPSGTQRVCNLPNQRFAAE